MQEFNTKCFLFLEASLVMLQQRDRLSFWIFELQNAAKKTRNNVRTSLCFSFSRRSCERNPGVEKWKKQNIKRRKSKYKPVHSSSSSSVKMSTRLRGHNVGLRMYIVWFPAQITKQHEHSFVRLSYIVWCSVGRTSDEMSQQSRLANAPLGDSFPQRSLEIPLRHVYSRWTLNSPLGFFGSNEWRLHRCPKPMNLDHQVSLLRPVLPRVRVLLPPPHVTLQPFQGDQSAHIQSWVGSGWNVMWSWMQGLVLSLTRC